MNRRALLGLLLVAGCAEVPPARLTSQPAAVATPVAVAVATPAPGPTPGVRLVPGTPAPTATPTARPTARPTTDHGFDFEDVATLIGLPELEGAAPPARSPMPVAFRAGNAATVHVGPAETFAAVKALIAGAKTSVDLETFNFGRGYAKALVPLLVERAKAGVAVRVLVDLFGSRALPGYDAIVGELRAGGVQVVAYAPKAFQDADDHQSFNITHRKVYLADGVHGLVGGVNLDSPFEDETHDMLTDWSGPVVADLYAEFGRDWARAGGGALPARGAVAPAGDVVAGVAVTSPFEGRYELRDAIREAIAGAAREILIEQQYMWDDDLVERLEAAQARGVAIRVIVPGDEQKAVQRALNANAMADLAAGGAQVRRYLGVPAKAHLHVKYFAVDDRWAANGSCNGDARALLDNQELDVLTTDPGVIKAWRERLFERDWQEFSTPFTPTRGGVVGAPFHTLVEMFDYYL